MRLILLLSFTLLLTVSLIVFPDIADQELRLEAFGWIFETRQGAFIIALLILLLVLWLLRLITRALFAGPGTVWRSLRSGSRKRREARLRAGLARWLDMRGDNGAKAIKRAKGVLPDWTMDLLKTLGIPAKDQQPGNEQDDALVTALAARIATDPGTHSKADLITRKAHLQAWLKVHPGAPLALSRMADMAEEEGNWPSAVQLLEAEWKQGHRSAHSIKPRLANAYVQLAEKQPEQAMAHLRKAYRLLPDERNILLAYGKQLLAHDDQKTAQRLWLAYLVQHNDFGIAHALLEVQRQDGMRCYRKLEKLKDVEMNTAQRWLRAELAHAAKLEGLAIEQMSALAENAFSSDAWKSLADWHNEAGEIDKAADCYNRTVVLLLEERSR